MIKDRKFDHIKLAPESQIEKDLRDQRFDYEPLFSDTKIDNLKSFKFLNKTLNAPIWVSSMTGGTQIAKNINKNIAKVCKQFGLGMGLGSCRGLLKNKKLINDFAIRKFLGYESPLFANLGISQIEQCIYEDSILQINNIINDLEADGLIIHINPIQEFLQPEGDIIKVPPIQTIKTFLESVNYPVIIKEVGQGLGPQSIKALLKLPLAAIEFGAMGGTNFSSIEIKRSNLGTHNFNPLQFVGHSAEDMLDYINEIIEKGETEIQCKNLIISGGIKDFLHGYYLIKKSKLKAIYGQAYNIIKYAMIGYEELNNYIKNEIKGLAIAGKLLRIK